MLRKVGGIVLAVFLPLILRKSDKHQDYITEMWAWQSTQVNTYRSKPYIELMSLPEITQLSAPEKFKKYNFALCRREGENGGVEISIRHYQRFLLIISAGSGVGFEMLANGIILDEPEESLED